MIQIYEMSEIADKEIFFRQTGVKDVSAPVAEILRQVRAEGDAPLLRCTRQFDGVELESLQVSETEIEQAFAQADKEFLDVLLQAAENIRAYHQKQVPQVSAGLAASIFHFGELSIADLKKELAENDIEVRL